MNFNRGNYSSFSSLFASILSQHPCDWLIGESSHGRQVKTTRSDSPLLTACDFKQHFVIEAQSEFWHPWQDHFELDGPHYFTAQDAAAGTHLKMKGHRIALNMRSVPVGLETNSGIMRDYFWTDMIRIFVKSA